ncbi:SDR family NAD(P)-dependent oxidoreductase [Flagellimonas nanhaiensis]|uniref:SDR family NAD(P)-dependent oxidoreductase n=1 Tax=Flagellimonas nanhaiensis TaxID=2292706 RepID=A0A371JTB4_9FLAO|nr:SDR family NAD(P)-dependent oxidoreductase [Allomuricauda nanhaiensis]RDY61045.1 SDR family NAD(P)-dependent oxidoreductase [Allomuricauda nanhaiensis]
MKKTILITGSTDGIGKLTAIKLAKLGHTIILHGRKRDKLEKTVSEIELLTKNNNIHGFLADFSDLSAVRQMTLAIKEKFNKIDVLINNAGIFKSPSVQKGAVSIQLVVNYLAPYLLTTELLPLIQKGTDPRIINLSSAAQSSVSLDALEGKQTLGFQAAYAQSKLALTMWSFHLAKKEKNIVVIAVNPGSLLNTKMVQEAYGQSWSSAEKGGEILFNLAIDHSYSTASGKYFDNDQGAFAPAHPDAYESPKIEDLITSTNAVLNKSL